MRWKTGEDTDLFDHIRRDYRRLADYRGGGSFGFWIGTLLFDNGFQAVWCYRMARWFKAARIPAIPALLARSSILLTGADINPNAEIGPGLVISHGVGLVVGGDVVAGERLLLHHQVTLGAPTPSRIGQMPRIGDDVAIGAGAIVIGGVTVGDGAFLGAGTLIVEDVPAGTKVTREPTPVGGGEVPVEG